MDNNYLSRLEWLEPGEACELRIFLADRGGPSTLRVETDQRLGYHLAHLEEIEKRLIVSGYASHESDARLRAATRHLRFRESLEVDRRVRAREVVEEFRRLDGYRRFSLGMASAMADLTR